MLLILTGGEPLLRADLEQISARAASRGMMVVVGTSGTLLTADRARSLATAGVAGVGVSIDFDGPEAHDRLRGVPGAWRAALDAVRVARAAGLQVSIQTTLLRANRARLAAVAALASAEGARVLSAYFLVCTGRAEELTDLSPSEYDATLVQLRVLEGRYRGRMLVAPKCAPHYRRVVAEREGPGAEVHAFGGGCPAGVSYLRIGPRGEVTPCPYLPLVLGTAGETPLSEIWTASPVLRSLRARELRGKCGACDYRATCGGCRARAFAATADVLATDPSCAFSGIASSPPARGVAHHSGACSAPATYGAPARATMTWTADASARLGRVPSVLRAMVVARVERAARQAGEAEVTVERMQAVRRGAVGHPNVGHRDGAS